MSRKWKPIAVGLLGGLVGAVVGYSGINAWPRHIPVYWALVGFAGSFLASIVLHELGHLGVGLLVRFQPVLFVIGPWRLRRTPAGWLSDFGRLGFLGGAAVSVPVDNRDLTGRVRLYLAGGAAANLLSAIIGIQFANSTTLQGSLAGTFAIVNFIVVWLALWPAKGAGVQTDGSHLLMLRRGGPECDRWLAAYWIIGLSFLGERPSAWPKDEVHRATELQDQSADDFQSAMILYAWHLDRGDLDGARAALSRASDSFASTNVLSHAEYHIESAFMAALDGDIATADEQLGKVTGKLFRQAALYRARAARATAAGDHAEAHRLAKLGILAAPLDWDAGQNAVDLEWLNRFAGDTVSR